MKNENEFPFPFSDSEKGRGRERSRAKPNTERGREEKRPRDRKREGGAPTAREEEEREREGETPTSNPNPRKRKREGEREKEKQKSNPNPKMMKGCGYEQNAMAGCKGLRMVVGSVVCPKPRRLGILNPSINDHIRPLRYPTIPFQSEVGDSQVGTELLDIILTKGNSSEIHNSQVPSSPPYFCGSPPSRASNPVIQDEQFGNGKVGFVSATPPRKREGAYKQVLYREKEKERRRRRATQIREREKEKQKR